MTALQVAWLLTIFVGMGYLYWWLVSFKDRELKRVCSDPRSRTVSVAGCGTMFIPRFDPLVENGSILYMPTGDGLYQLRRKESRNQKFRNGLERWLQRGAILHVIVSSPNDRVRELWQPLKDLYPQLLHVHFLDRDRVTGVDQERMRDVIAKLDTFHATVLLNPPHSRSAPGALWIELNHPIGSKYAYNVEYVSPADARTDQRLNEYYELYVELLQNSCSTELCPSAQTGEAESTLVAAA